MSFQDLESGHKIGQIFPDPKQVVASGIFQINTALTTFHRLVYTLGTHKDTVNLRVKLHKTRLHIRELVKITENASKKITDVKLAKDFQAVIREFQKAQRLATEREKAYTPFVFQENRSSRNIDISDRDIYGGLEHTTPFSPRQNHTDSDRDIYCDSEQTPVIDNYKKQDEEVLALFDNKTIIEEREQGIHEIENHIIEVNTIFKDLTVLVREQGSVIDMIGSDAENAHVATGHGRSQLVKAANSQESNSSLACLILFGFGIVFLIVIILLVA